MNTVCRKFRIRIVADRNFLEIPKGNSNERPGRQKVSVENCHMCPFLLKYEYNISILTKWTSFLFLYHQIIQSREIAGE